MAHQQPPFPTKFNPPKIRNDYGTPDKGNVKAAGGVDPGQQIPLVDTPSPATVRGA